MELPLGRGIVSFLVAFGRGQEEGSPGKDPRLKAIPCSSVRPVEALLRSSAISNVNNPANQAAAMFQIYFCIGACVPLPRQHWFNPSSEASFQQLGQAH